MGRPKPLLPLDGETFLDRLIAAFSGICRPITVVLGYDAERIRAGIRRAAAAEFVVNPAPDRGMLSSLQCGLEHLGENFDAVLFTPADLPFIHSSTIAAVAGSDAAIVIPRCGGGHRPPRPGSRAPARGMVSLPGGGPGRRGFPS